VKVLIIRLMGLGDVASILICCRAVFTMHQNQCSRSSRMGVHDAPEYASRAIVSFLPTIALRFASPIG
jgi:hypothetical protein